jgi:hypothetical protein
LWPPLRGGLTQQEALEAAVIRYQRLSLRPGCHESTEFGWTTNPSDPSYAWYATSEEARGELIVEALRYARAHWGPWLGVMSLWTLADPDWSLEDHNVWDDEMYWWAITNPDGTNRPAFERLVQAREAGELP